MNSIESGFPTELLAPRPDTGRSGELGQDDFLRLMLKQLENQDPTKPMESGDFLGQIAQFGTVSGIKDLKNAFSDMSSALVQEQSLRAASLLDRQVLVPAEAVPLGDSGPLTGAVDLPGMAGEVDIEIIGPGGERVDRMKIHPTGPGLNEFSWDGIGSDGRRVPSGQYAARATVEIDGAAEMVPTLLHARVEGVELDAAGTGVQLDIGTHATVALEDVRRID